jgi:hypothetical protein
LRASLRDGAAYAFAAGANEFGRVADPENVAQVFYVYAKSLRVVWLVVMAVALSGFIIVPFERSLGLRKENNTEFGLKVQKEEGLESENL